LKTAKNGLLELLTTLAEDEQRNRKEADARAELERQRVEDERRRAEDERRRTEEAESRAHIEESKTRQTTFEEYIRTCYTLLSRQCLGNVSDCSRVRLIWFLFLIPQVNMNGNVHSIFSF
jgi:hypothetical protein